MGLLRQLRRLLLVDLFVPLFLCCRCCRFDRLNPFGRFDQWGLYYLFGRFDQWGLCCRFDPYYLFDQLRRFDPWGLYYLLSPLIR